MRQQLAIWLGAALLIIGFSPAFAQGGPPVHTGVVLETMDSGGYTYMRIEEDGTAFWAATPRVSVTKGETVSVSEQMWMPNFTSGTLNRTFDRILFASVVGGAGPAVSNTRPTLGVKAPIEKAEGGYTVAEIYAQKEALKGKTVKVRGQVVKVSNNIMQRTWVHLQDGSGDAATQNIVFRTQGTAPDVGAIVTARGTLDTDRDFGYGYVYGVIVEDASFVR